MIKQVLSLVLFAGICSVAAADSKVDGTWNFQMSSPMGSVSATVTMKVDGATLTGEFDLGNGRKWPIQEGSVEGDDISFLIDRDGRMTYRMRAQLDGDSIAGVAMAMGSEAPWSMSRGS